MEEGFLPWVGFGVLMDVSARDGRDKSEVFRRGFPSLSNVVGNSLGVENGVEYRVDSK